MHLPLWLIPVPLHEFLAGKRGAKNVAGCASIPPKRLNVSPWQHTQPTVGLRTRLLSLQILIPSRPHVALLLLLVRPPRSFLEAQIPTHSIDRVRVDRFLQTEQNWAWCLRKQILRGIGGVTDWSPFALWSLALEANCPT